jgi:hypothetical protein
MGAHLLNLSAAELFGPTIEETESQEDVLESLPALVAASMAE